MPFRTLEISNPDYLGCGISFVTVKSAALKRRGDISFYVPPGIKAQKLPVVILLHGVYGSHWAWLFKGGAHKVLDRLIEPERSYRGTLAGMRHGVDLVELIFQVAQVQGRRELQQWCARWLTERRPLVEAVAAELAWFAQSPAEAVGKPGSHRPLRPEPSLSQAQV